MNVKDIIQRGAYTREDLHYLLGSKDDEELALFAASERVRNETVGNKVYLRGLIELTNVCQKDCYYCGIRNSNASCKRYNVEDREVVEAAIYAHNKGFGSLAIQSGEMQSAFFTERISRLLEMIHRQTHHELCITLSLGEQSEDTYKQWRSAGAHRYLLRIESSNKDLYAKLHPSNSMHDYDTRIACLKTLRKVGYQVGTGVMIGLPFQTIDHLVDDLLFLKDMDVDMCGMGPYLEHEHTPLYVYREQLISKSERLKLTLHMLACLRLLMPNINMAATTALQAIAPNGREMAIKIAANVMMPNITPGHHRDDYALYQGKPNTQGDVDSNTSIENRKEVAGSTIVYYQQGNSAHYSNRNKK